MCCSGAATTIFGASTYGFRRWKKYKISPFYAAAARRTAQVNPQENEEKKLNEKTAAPVPRKLKHLGWLFPGKYIFMEVKFNKSRDCFMHFLLQKINIY